MGIFFYKSLFCGCKIVACQSREDKNCIILVNHTYKNICKKCINLPDKLLNTKLDNMKRDDDRIYVSFVNGWYRSPSSPTDYSKFIDIYSF